MGLLPIILISISVALIAWWLALLAGELFSGERKRLKERLSDLSISDPVRARHQLLLVQMEASGIARTLAKYRFFQNLYRNLLQAWPNLSLGRFLAICAAGGFFGFVIATVLFMSLFFGLLGGLGAASIPFLILNAKRSRRQRAIADQLPEALDFLSRILKAGHSLTTGIQMMGDELPAPLAAEFRRCYDQHSLGQPIEESLKDMSNRIDSQDFSFFVTAVLIQRQTGGDLSEVLGNISGMIRARIRLAQQVKAKTSEGRFTGYILVIFPAAMFLLMYALNPTYCEIMVKTNKGLTMLGIAFLLQVGGLLAIRKITSIRV
ncbi:MAG TPA: type II secretion system F family protein [Tepidisphaeraceae bacterium]|nr:type II secretion system F family protein [Tepidisphaeraceae bacterium]